MTPSFTQNYSVVVKREGHHRERIEPWRVTKVVVEDGRLNVAPDELGGEVLNGPVSEVTIDRNHITSESTVYLQVGDIRWEIDFWPVHSAERHGKPGDFAFMTDIEQQHALDRGKEIRDQLEAALLALGATDAHKR